MRPHTDVIKEGCITSLQRSIGGDQIQIHHVDFTPGPDRRGDAVLRVSAKRVNATVRLATFNKQVHELLNSRQFYITVCSNGKYRCEVYYPYRAAVEYSSEPLTSKSSQPSITTLPAASTTAPATIATVVTAATPATTPTTALATAAPKRVPCKTYDDGNDGKIGLHVLDVNCKECVAVPGSRVLACGECLPGFELQEVASTKFPLCVSALATKRTTPQPTGASTLDGRATTPKPVVVYNQSLVVELAFQGFVQSPGQMALLDKRAIQTEFGTFFASTFQQRLSVATMRVNRVPSTDEASVMLLLKQVGNGVDDSSVMSKLHDAVKNRLLYFTVCEPNKYHCVTYYASRSWVMLRNDLPEAPFTTTSRPTMTLAPVTQAPTTTRATASSVAPETAQVTRPDGSSREATARTRVPKTSARTAPWDHGHTTTTTHAPGHTATNVSTRPGATPTASSAGGTTVGMPLNTSGGQPLGTAATGADGADGADASTGSDGSGGLRSGYLYIIIAASSVLVLILAGLGVASAANKSSSRKRQRAEQEVEMTYTHENSHAPALVPQNSARGPPTKAIKTQNDGIVVNTQFSTVKLQQPVTSVSSMIVSACAMNWEDRGAHRGNLDEPDGGAMSDKSEMDGYLTPDSPSDASNASAGFSTPELELELEETFTGLISEGGAFANTSTAVPPTMSSMPGHVGAAVVLPARSKPAVDTEPLTLASTTARHMPQTLTSRGMPALHLRIDTRQDTAGSSASGSSSASASYGAVVPAPSPKAVGNAAVMPVVVAALMPSAHAGDGSYHLVGRSFLFGTLCYVPVLINRCITLCGIVWSVCWPSNPPWYNFYNHM